MLRYLDRLGNMQYLLPYPMARAARNIFDPQVGAAGAYGDAIITSGDPGVEDGDSRRHLNVNSICVWAFPRG